MNKGHRLGGDGVRVGWGWGEGEGGSEMLGEWWGEGRDEVWGERWGEGREGERWGEGRDEVWGERWGESGSVINLTVLQCSCTYIRSFLHMYVAVHLQCIRMYVQCMPTIVAYVLFT